MNDPNILNITLGYVLCCQSPVLFLGAAVLLICYFARRKDHRVRAVLDLILAIACAVGGVVLYFLGIGWEHLTIRDFLLIRPVGWVGLGIVAVLSVFFALRALLRYNRRRMAQKADNRAINAQRFAQAEEAKAAVAATAEAVSETVEQVLDEQSLTAAAEAAEATELTAAVTVDDSAEEPAAAQECAP